MVPFPPATDRLVMASGSGVEQMRDQEFQQVECDKGENLLRRNSDPATRLEISRSTEFFRGKKKIVPGDDSAVA
jgi:hypothetical protein